MRYLRFLALALLLVGCRASATTRTYAYGAYDRGDTAEVLRIKGFISQRMDTLSAVFGIVWPDGWFPSVRIGLPDILPVDRQRYMQALYNPDSSIISFHPLMFSPVSLHPLRSLVLSPPEAVVDHELGHGFISEYTRQLTGEVWPPQHVKLKPDEGLGVYLLSEGLARVVEFHANGDTASMADERWEEYVSASWVLHDGELYQAVVQDRSYHLLMPLVQRYGLKAIIAYAVSHPIKIHHGQLRKAVSRWRQQAERDLAKAARPHSPE